jgi:hypothetical protein
MGTPTRNLTALIVMVAVTLFAIATIKPMFRREQLELGCHLRVDNSFLVALRSPLFGPVAEIITAVRKCQWTELTNRKSTPNGSRFLT